MTRARMEQIFVKPTEMELDDIHRLRKHTDHKRRSRKHNDRKSNKKRQDHRSLMSMTRKMEQEW